jgi:hypothetical protein
MDNNQPLDPRQLPAYTRSQVATMFGISVNTVNNWVAEGRFRTASGEPVAWKEKHGRREWFIVAAAVHRLLDAVRIVTPPPATVAEAELDTITVYSVIFPITDVNDNKDVNSSITKGKGVNA